MFFETILVIHLTSTNCPNMADMEKCGSIVAVYGGSTECNRRLDHMKELIGEFADDIYCITVKKDKVPI